MNTTEETTNQGVIEKPWWKGNGRGYIRPFITQDDEMTCTECGEEDMPETAFPTLTIPRKDGRKRGRICRECVKVKRAKAKKAAERKAARDKKKGGGA